MESSWVPRMGADGPLAGTSTPFTAHEALQAHAVTANQGDVNLAGRDVHVHKHYHSYSDGIDITAVLEGIRNLRKVHLDVLSKVTPGTGVWLLRNDRFLVWLDLNGDLKILWGIGIPGAGKTVLASIVIRELEARAAAAGGHICVCYVYIRYSDRADLTVRNILEILVKQTVERHPNVALLAEHAYARHVRERTQPTEAELLQLLLQFTEAIPATFYLLDALDEAPDRIQVDLVQKLASLNVRLFITSRPLKTVEARVPDAHIFHIVAQEGDLDLHLAQEIARSQDLADLLDKVGSSLRDEIVSLVKSKCGGMFLHASLQLDALCECVTVHDVRHTLGAFPSRIEDVYLQTWQRILEQRPNRVSLAKAALLWVLNASRSMTIEELERAVATSPDSYKLEPDRLAPGTTLMAFCRGLVILEEESRLVRLVHYTAKDTLQGLLSSSFPHPHPHLAMVCMTHLAECGFQSTTLRSLEEFNAALKADPLLAYASDTWVLHARQSLHIDVTRRQIATFISESSGYPSLTYPENPESFDILRPLHILAIHNLPLSLITRDGVVDPNVTTHIDQDTPLTLASCLGHTQMVTFLLTCTEIQVNLAEVRRQMPLMFAARFGRETVVKLLLARPEILVNLANVEGWSALMEAARYGHEDIATLLLARPEILVNLVTINGWSALKLAACNGHEGVARLLLARPEIQVNLVDDNGRSALMDAASDDYEGIVILLLAHPDIQINLVDNKGQSALMKADESVVKLFLARPEIQVNLVDNKGTSALMRQSTWGYEGIVELLLACPETQVNLVNNEGCSALMMAARYGYENIVEQLLGRPEIQVNLVDADGRSALMVASGDGYEGIAELLLAHPQTQVNLVDKERRSALMLAAQYGYESIVEQLLVRPEIQVNLVDDQGRSALMLAAHQGHESVVRLLLAVPHLDTAIANAEDGLTAASIAVANGHMEIVQLIRDFELREAEGQTVDEEEGSGYDSDSGSDIYQDAEEWLGGEDDVLSL